jgi:hypothetical protein
MNQGLTMSVVKAVLLGCLVVVPSTTCRADFEAIKGWSGHLFPSYIIATAAMKPPEKSEKDNGSGIVVLGDQRGLLGVAFSATDDDQKVIVTISCDAIMEPSVFSATLAEKGKTYILYPKIKYKYDDLAKRSQTGPITVTYIVQVGDDDPEEKAETITLRSINDCPYSIATNGKWQSVRFMFAAYVNEQHPFVDNVLREALDTRVVDAFMGYQGKDATSVYRQVYAVWHALSLRDVRYSSITTTVAKSETVGSQHVRMIDESINNGQANCLDGSVLMASLLRKINIEPLLVHVPGHCYLAFFLDEEGKELVALETTMIGGTIEGDAKKVPGLENIVDDDFRSENSWKTFAAAIATGTANLKKFDKNFKDENDHNYALISVAAARNSGILPIAFQSNQQFVEVATDDTTANADDADEKDDDDDDDDDDKNEKK